MTELQIFSYLQSRHILSFQIFEDMSIQANVPALAMEEILEYLMSVFTLCLRETTVTTKLIHAAPHPLVLSNWAVLHVCTFMVSPSLRHSSYSLELRLHACLTSSKKIMEEIGTST